MGDLNGKVIYERNSRHYNLKYISNDFSYTVYRKFNNKKISTRRIKNEIVTFSSQELKDNISLPVRMDKPVYLPGDFIVVNKEDYWEAASNLNQ
jgi:hypothetical protein